MRYMRLAIRIRTWRLARRLTQADLATAAGVTVSAISHLERDEAEPSQQRLEAIVARLGLTMSRFYGRTPRVRAAA